ncbi:potassium channel family protein [Anaerocolumna sp. AGMB13025]|uniref:potassium channel family protein n=1 Tax=Anaerocolumna sp. AGMB13025 TaxID=3039116 RepID=UPI00241C7203|nr:potassium channel family protein [Anaerocolumna sp. AGMB13025]WFR56868.1 potassium channel family protein [Anaerocolumna sp. AGMB13025]
MDDILILAMTMIMLLYFFREIWKNRLYLLKYIATVGGKSSAAVHVKPAVLIPVAIFHGVLFIAVGVVIFLNDSEGRIAFRLLISSILSLICLLLLFLLYFLVVVIIKEIVSMKDKTINCILIYSGVSFCILFGQLITRSIEYPKGFIWISAVLYVVNIFGIGRIIWTIFKKKVLVKSIWSIAFMNISFAIFALSNITFEIQNVYPTACYSRELTSWGDALYFVVITFFTVGYGDLYPVCEATKILSMITILSGFTFTAVFVSAALSTTIEHFGSIQKK